MVELRVFVAGLDGGQIAHLLSDITATIEVYGTSAEAQYTAEAVNMILNNGSLEPLDTLLQLLLDDMRKELGLEAIARRASVFGFQGSRPATK
ncbi:hypothetical protein HC891_08915 [Candidatus Gracilibacteria bacterium]|nr:hypothetical protein [Candidatus Gracilibacteria bacterium]